MEIKLHYKTWVKEEISKETKHLELDKNEKTTYQNLWDMRKECLRETCGLLQKQICDQ